MTIDFDYSRNPFRGEIWEITSGRRKGGHFTVLDWYFVDAGKQHIRVLTVCDALDEKPFQLWQYKIGFWRVYGTQSFDTLVRAVNEMEQSKWVDSPRRAARLKATA